MGNEGVIIVGVDGSDSARLALRFALEEAARRGARVRAVMAFSSVQYWPVGPEGLGAGLPPSPRQLADDAKRTVRESVAQTAAAVGGAAAAVPVDVSVAQGSPAQVLIDEAARADMLVVGHRGRGVIASACLGSVGLQCVLHATCPVTVVRPSASVTVPGKAAPATAGRPTT